MSRKPASPCLRSNILSSPSTNTSSHSLLMLCVPSLLPLFIGPRPFYPLLASSRLYLPSLLSIILATVCMTYSLFTYSVRARAEHRIQNYFKFPELQRHDSSSWAHQNYNATQSSLWIPSFNRRTSFTHCLTRILFPQVFRGRHLDVIRKPASTSDTFTAKIIAAGRTFLLSLTSRHFFRMFSTLSTSRYAR